jgi:hypothetical protein
MKELLQTLNSLRTATDESVRRQNGDPDPKFLWSGYGCIILRNRIRSLIEQEVRFDESR